MGVWRNSVHVSVVSPMMRDTDRYGFLLGLASTAAKHFSRSYEIVPIVERVQPFEELPSAYEKVSLLHGRGKTVLTW
ncbi:hypothetical protein ANCCAN_08452 [Ancylostoma caninum]|uniref:Uncharacterized protein n=1 Tax=Ancylostoma caninum TaxID=29170 RepID=A0A368GMB2_ANCCA|nr:hypothetical protein ANCCAN_08452 [Ancylostoma caninum]